MLQLRVFKKDLQQFYKSLVLAEEGLEKMVNDMILNVNDSIQEAEWS